VPEDEIFDWVRKYADNHKEPVAAPNGRSSPHLRSGHDLPPAQEAHAASLGSEESPKRLVPRKCVKRGAVYRRAREMQLRIGEPLFIKESPGKFIQVGTVKP
jgi:hypothetical protein